VPFPEPHDPEAFSACHKRLISSLTFVAPKAALSKTQTRRTKQNKKHRKKTPNQPAVRQDEDHTKARALSAT
jgi:hypothetical protein